MPTALNEDIAGRLDEVARILAEQGASRYRVQAYHHASEVLRGLAQPVAEIFAAEGLAGLEKLPGVGVSIARAIRDLLQHGRLGMLDRLRGEHDPIALLRSVPGVGKGLDWKLHDDLGIESLEELETAAHDGRLENLPGLGAKRLAGIRDSLAHRLGRIRRAPVVTPPALPAPSSATRPAWPLPLPPVPAPKTKPPLIPRATAGDDVRGGRRKRWPAVELGPVRAAATCGVIANRPVARRTNRGQSWPIEAKHPRAIGATLDSAKPTQL